MSDFTKGIQVGTPVGRLSYPYLFNPKPNTLKNNKLEFRTDLIIPYECAADPQHSLRMQQFFDALQNVGAAKFGAEFSWASCCDDAVLAKFGVERPSLRQKNPCVKDFTAVLKDAIARKKMQSKETTSEEKMLESMGDCFLVKAWTSAGGEKYSIEDSRPTVYKPVKNSDGTLSKMTAEEVKGIKGGDWARLGVLVKAYTHQSGTWGISLYLNFLQFWKQDESFGGGGEGAALDILDSLEVPVEDAGAFAPQGAVAGVPAFIQGSKPF